MTVWTWSVLYCVKKCSYSEGTGNPIFEFNLLFCDFHCWFKCQSSLYCQLSLFSLQFPITSSSDLSSPFKFTCKYEIKNQTWTNIIYYKDAHWNRQITLLYLLWRQCSVCTLNVEIMPFLKFLHQTGSSGSIFNSLIWPWTYLKISMAEITWKYLYKQDVNLSKTGVKDILNSIGIS